MTEKIARWCGASGKVCYAVRRKAKQYAKRELSLYGKRMRVYQCPFCRQYHLATIKTRKAK